MAASGPRPLSAPYRARPVTTVAVRAQQQGHDHRAAGRIVSQGAARAQRQHVPDISQDDARAVNKIAESRVTRTDEAPEHAEHQQAGNGIARPDMDQLQPLAAQPVLEIFEQLALGEPCSAETDEQGPVEETDQRVPNRNFTCLDNTHGYLLAVPPTDGREAWEWIRC
jgi:hypothetical protein